MRPEDWSRISPLLDELLDLPDEVRRLRLLELRSESPGLADQVERLIALDEDRPGFLAEPVMEGVLSAYQPGQDLGPYRLVRVLGEGGMGQVWEAVRADGLYERRVALKLLRPGYADHGLRSRFTRERLILARLAHAHIARLLDAGVSADGQPYLALEYIHGEAITAYAQRLKLSVSERLRLFLQVCEAVSHAHANLVVHRNLKPNNILVTPAGDVRLLDFGIAKLLDRGERDETEITRVGARAFTLHYAAPEQIRGEPVTTMTDVYSLGVVLYELLTGHQPYRLQRKTDAEWEEAILTCEPVRPSLVVGRPHAGGSGAVEVPDRRLARALAGDLDNIVLRALRKAPEQRYPSVDALAQDIRRHIEGRPVLARPQSLGYRLRKYLQRHAAGVSVMLGVVLLLSLGLLGMRWQYNQVLVEAARAQAMQDFVVGLFEHGGVAGRDRTVDVRLLLDAGVRRAETELNDQPGPRAELLGLIARLRNGLGDYREALQALDRQQSALRALGEEAPPGLLLESLLQRGRALRALGAPQSCIEVMRDRLALVERDTLIAPLPSAEYYSQLGRCHRQLGQAEDARRLFERALMLRRGVNAGVDEAESLTDLASLDADAARIDIAIAGFRQALDRLRVATGERHPLAVNIWRSLGSLYRERGDVSAAEGAFRQALDTSLTLFGAQHPSTIEVQRLLGALFVDLGRLDEGERLVSEAHVRLRERFGDRHPDIAATHNSLGIIAYERGRLDEAQRELARAVAIWRQTVGAGRLPGALYNLGMVQHAVGDHEAAIASLDEALRLRVQQYGASHALVGNTRRLIGEVRAALGQEAAALEELRAAVDILRRDYGPDHPQTGQAELSLARQLWRTRSASQAIALAQSVEQRFQPDDSERRKLLWWARALRAEALCRSGQYAQGRLALEGVLVDMSIEWPQGALRRSVEQLHGSCLPVGLAQRVAGD